MKRGGETRSGSGCGFIILTCVVACCFLLLNGLLISLLYHWFVSIAPETLQDLIKSNRDVGPIISQAVLFIGPIVLLFFEWWLVDWVVDRVTPNRNKDVAENGK